MILSELEAGPLLFCLSCLDDAPCLVAVVMARFRFCPFVLPFLRNITIFYFYVIRLDSEFFTQKVSFNNKKKIMGSSFYIYIRQGLIGNPN